MRILGLLIFLSSGLWAANLDFKKMGHPVTTLALETLTAKISPVTLVYKEAEEGGKIRRYQAIPFRKVLEAVYGPKITDIDEVLFTCADGYQPSVPFDSFRRRTSYLVYAADDGLPFEFKSTKSGETVSYGPYYLVWDQSVAQKGDGFHESRPYQVVGVDLIRFQDRFPALAPPAQSGLAVNRGFLLYRENCLQCHRLNGEGGGKAPELNYPVNVTEYFKESVLVKWILDPSSVRHGAQMFPLNPQLPNRAQAARDLVAYLRAMAKRKIAPQEQPQ